MPLLALYTCPVLTCAPGDEAYAAFAGLDAAIAAELAGRPPEGLVRVVADLPPPGRWPAHVAPAGGTPKPTLSVWRSLEAAFAYSYGPGLHRRALRRRREWCLRPAGPVYVLWYVAEADAAVHDAAIARLDRLGAAGPGPEAFDFRHPFDPGGRPVDPRPLAALRGDAAGAGPAPLPLRESGMP